MKNKLFSLLVIALLSTSCSASTRRSDMLLKDVYKDYFSIGAAFNDGSIPVPMDDEDAVVDDGLYNHFNSLTCENDMKWEKLHPSEYIYDYEKADKYVEFAKTHNMGVRGHALVWYRALPGYMNKSRIQDKETLLLKEKEHIDNVIEHFGDSVYCWDVVNEVISDSEDEIITDENAYRQDDFWYELSGKEYILKAFEYADAKLKELGIREKVKLFYNDYDNTKPVKKAKTMHMLNWLLKENCPIDGIGLQCHYNMGSFVKDELESAIVDYSSLGLEVQITEFDVDIYDETPSMAIEESYDILGAPEKILDAQATIYDHAFKIFRKHKDKISNVTFWGIRDNNTYMNDPTEFVGHAGPNFPYIFDIFGEKKPAFYVIADYED